MDDPKSLKEAAEYGVALARQALGKPMTEISDDVVERAAKAIAEEMDCADEWKAFTNEARAAITEAVKAEREECAKVAAEEQFGFPPEQLTEYGKGHNRVCQTIAAAIRARGEE